MKEFQKRLLSAFSACALACALAFGIGSMNATPSRADETAAPEQTGENLQLVAKAATTGKITIPTSLASMEDSTNVTTTLTVSATDFNYWGDNPYSNDPYVIFRQNATAEYQVWYRVIRNGMLQVFDGKIGVTENILLNVNVWQQHIEANSSWTLKVVSTATSAEFFAGETSYGTVSYTSSAAAFDVDFAANFYGYLSKLSCKIDGVEKVTLNKASKIDGFVVSDVFVPAGASAVTLDVPFDKKYIKNKTTGKYDRVSDLEVKYTINCMDTGAAIDPFYNVPISYFYMTKSGEKIGIRNCSNGIASLFSGVNQGTTVYTPAYHGYYDVLEDGVTKKYNCPYAYFYEITVKKGLLTMQISGSQFVTAEDIGEGTFMLELGTNAATAYNGITMQIVSDDEYDYNDVKDADYLDLITKSFTELGYMTYDEETNSISDPECKTSYNVHEPLSTAFEGVYTTDLVTVLSYKVQLDAAPKSLSEVPGVSFWKNSATGDTYDLQAYDGSNTYVMLNGGLGTFAELGYCALHTAGNRDWYSVSITIEKGTATIVVDGNQGVVKTTVELPDGKPICELFTRGTPATFYDVKMYTTSIDKFEQTGEDATFAKALAVTKAPTAEKFGDALAGGEFKVTYFDGTEKTFTLDSEEITVAGYDEEIAGTEQTYEICFNDGKTKLVATESVTLVDYAVRIVLDYEKDEYLYGEAFEEITVLAITASGAEEDVTAEATVTGYDANTLGEQTISVTYGEFTKTYTVTVSDYATGIEAEIDKTVYEIGETVGNVTVQLVYASGAKETVTGTVSGFDSSEAGSVTLTVTYEEFQTELTITVNERQPETPDSSSDTSSDTSSEASSEPSSEASADPASDSDDDSRASGVSVTGGCGSALGAGLAILPLFAGMALIVRKKRK